jgi:hypothetical protein
VCCCQTQHNHLSHLQGGCRRWSPGAQLTCPSRGRNSLVAQNTTGALFSEQSTVMGRKWLWCWMQVRGSASSCCRSLCISSTQQLHLPPKHTAPAATSLRPAVPLFPAATGDIVREATGNLRPALDAANNWHQWEPPVLMLRLSQHLVSKQQGAQGGRAAAAATT